MLLLGLPSARGYPLLRDLGKTGESAHTRGTETAVKLGMWSIDFYRNQQAVLGVDSGFVEQGYFMPAFDEAERVVGGAEL